METRSGKEQKLDGFLAHAVALRAQWAPCSSVGSLRAIAAGLDERGIPAARGGQWSAPQVMWLLERAGIPFGVSAPSGGSVPSGASVVAA